MDAALDLSHTQNIGRMTLTGTLPLRSSHVPEELPVLQVDAALDLSHTQNIGCMIKTHYLQ